MLEIEISKRFSRKIDKKRFKYLELVRLQPREIDLVVIDTLNFELVSYEFKRGLWKKAFIQALKNKLYCHYSYVVIPQKEYQSILLDEFSTHGIGLITYRISSDNKVMFKELTKPNKSDLVNRNFKKQIYKKFALVDGLIG